MCMGKNHECPKCKFACIETKVASICPNCDYVHIKKYEWVGETTKCPKCHKLAKLYKNQGAGKTFICSNCETSGRFIDDKELQAKIINKNTEIGRKLAWLFDIPTTIFHHNKEILEDEDCKVSRCPHCDVKEICDTHLDQVTDFCEKQKIDVYVTNDSIEIVHK
jgi:hypothetical protein